MKFANTIYFKITIEHEFMPTTPCSAFTVRDTLWRPPSNIIETATLATLQTAGTSNCADLLSLPEPQCNCECCALANSIRGYSLSRRNPNRKFCRILWKSFSEVYNFENCFTNGVELVCQTYFQSPHGEPIIELLFEYFNFQMLATFEKRQIRFMRDFKIWFD